LKVGARLTVGGTGERVLKDKDGGQLVATVAAQKELTAGDESD
jgi:hypothetical protein